MNEPKHKAKVARQKANVLGVIIDLKRASTMKRHSVLSGYTLTTQVTDLEKAILPSVGRNSHMLACASLARLKTVFWHSHPTFHQHPGAAAHSGFYYGPPAVNEFGRGAHP
jgi:hypothetical protein